MGKTRSPKNYPAVGLRDAIEAAKKIHQKDNLNPVSQDVVVQHLGYSGLSGRSMSFVSAIKKYGLLEGTNQALKISGDALAIIAEPESSPEHQAAINRCAFRPALFSELNDYFRGQRPSEENLRSYLIRQGFTSDAAGKAIRSYLDTIALVTPLAEGYDSGESSLEHEGKVAETPFSAASGRIIPSSGRPGGEEVEVIRTRLTATATGMVEIQGPVTQGAIDKLIWYLEGVKDTYPENSRDQSSEGD